MSTTLTACEVCGRSPATQVVIRRHVGMLIAQRFYKVTPVLCREDGMKLWRSWSTRTVIQGFRVGGATSASSRTSSRSR
jgi:hypothetical protein